MVGDAPGDYDAAAKNNVCFFPILVRKEEQSWRKLRGEDPQTGSFPALTGGNMRRRRFVELPGII